MRLGCGEVSACGEGAFLFSCGEEVGVGLPGPVGVWFTCRVDGSDDSAGGGAVPGACPCGVCLYDAVPCFGVVPDVDDCPVWCGYGVGVE